MSEAEKLQLELPNPGDTLVQRLGDDHIAFVYVNYDECPENPLEDCDGIGRIVAFNRRHSSFVHPDRVDEDPDRVTLSYFEHGQCLWGVQGTMSNMPDFMWDGTSVAGIWYPDDCIRDAVDRRQLKGGVRRKWMERQAAVACDLFTKYCNGSVFFWSVKVYGVRAREGGIFEREDDYRFDESDVEESCGGCYDLAYIVEEINNVFKFAMERLELDFAVEVEV